MTYVMPRPSKLELPPINFNEDSLGQRLAQLRKSNGYTQIQLAEKMGLTQGLVSAYERGRLRLHTEMLVRFAKALDVSIDMLIGLQKDMHHEQEHKFRLKIVRRMNEIDTLPLTQQKILLNTIDTFLRGAKKEKK